MLESQRVTIQSVAENACSFVTVTKDPKEQHLPQTQTPVVSEDEQGGRTSTSFVFKNGFLMYHVEVRKVSANITSSFFPESSRELGECLKPSTLLA